MKQYIQSSDVAMQTNRSGVVPFIRQEERNARYMRALCPLIQIHVPPQRQG
jgi:hypothetical protein